jgi:hypothetical protein
LARKRNPPSKAEAADKAASSQNGWAGTAEDWSRRAGPHNLTLDSRLRVTFRVLGMYTLVNKDALPAELTETVVLHVANLDRGGIEVVIAQAWAKSVDDPKEADRAVELVQKLRDLTLYLVSESLVAPKLAPKQLQDPALVPEGDLEQLMRLCTGREAFDSEGVRIGVEPISRLHTFRVEHECPAGCERCQAALDRLSSIDLGRV